MGAQPESAIRAMLEPYLIRESDSYGSKRRKQLASDTDAAIALLQQALLSDLQTFVCIQTLLRFCWTCRPEDAKPSWTACGTGGT